MTGVVCPWQSSIKYDADCIFSSALIDCDNFGSSSKKGTGYFSQISNPDIALFSTKKSAVPFLAFLGRISSCLKEHGNLDYGQSRTEDLGLLRMIPRLKAIDLSQSMLLQLPVYRDRSS